MAFEHSIGFRIESIKKEKFEKVCKDNEVDPSELLRDFVTEVIEGRVQIKSQSLINWNENHDRENI
jgi:antitoxin component of RelBE/YafQ-DinJ toxin-antitoxin module